MACEFMATSWIERQAPKNTKAKHSAINELVNPTINTDAPIAYVETTTTGALPLLAHCRPEMPSPINTPTAIHKSAKPRALFVICSWLFKSAIRE